MKRRITQNALIEHQAALETIRFDNRAFYIRNVGRYNLPGNFFFPPHYHDAIEVLATPGGVGGMVIAGGREFKLLDAQVIVIPSGTIHSFDLKSVEEHPFILLQIEPEWVVRTLAAFAGSESLVREGLLHLVNASGLRAKTLYATLQKLSTYALHPAQLHSSSSIESAVADLEIVASVLGVVATAEKAHLPPAAIEPMKEVISFIDHHSTENLALDQIAAQCAISKFHLCRSFKAQTGWTLREYLNHRRIAHAQALFDSGERNVSTVAYACGFSDPSHFTKLFVKYAGMQPKRYVLDRKDEGAPGSTAQ